MEIFDPNQTDKSSGNIGYEVINDLRGPRIKSPNRRSTPDSGRYLKSQEESNRNNKFQQEPSITPINPIVPRKIKKRSKQYPPNGIESRASNQHEPQLDAFRVIEI